MSVKKLLVLTAAGFVAMGATAVMAGGPDHMAMPAQAGFENSIYIDGHVGYAQSNWTSFNANSVIGVDSAFAPTSNGNGGVIGGADIGYNITQHIAAEGGWMYLPQVTGGVTTKGTEATLPTNSTATVNSWFAYMAAKLSVSVMENLDLFGKVGVAYRSLSYSTPTPRSSTAVAALNSATGNGQDWSPVFGAGLQYTLGSWLMGAQYLYLPGNSNENYGASGALAGAGAPNAAPEANLYTAFLGYKFNV